MKKSYLLLGMIVLGSVAGLNAMEQECLAAYRRYPFAGKMIDALMQPVKIKIPAGIVVDSMKVNWPAAFEIIDSMKGFIDINEYRTVGGITLLILAVRENNLLVAKTLLEKYKVDPNIFCTSFSKRHVIDQLPLMQAFLWDDLAMVGLLLKHGADPSLKDESGRDSLDYAKFAYKPEILELLKENLMSRRGPARAA